MPSKSPQRLAKLARANAAKNPPLSVEYDDIEPRFPGVSAAAKSTILELMGSKGFTQDNAERIVMHYISCFRLQDIGMGGLLTRKDEAVCGLVSGIFSKHYQRKAVR